MTLSVTPNSIRTLKKQKSPKLRQYQSYINNWKGMERPSLVPTTACKPKNLNFFSKKVEIEFWPVLKSWNHLSFVNISPTLVIETSMERFSQVQQHGKLETQKFLFFSKKVEIEISLVFWLVPEELKSPCFVNISPSLVNNTWMEWSLRVHEKSKILLVKEGGNNPFLKNVQFIYKESH